MDEIDVKFKRGNKAFIDALPIVDGQLIYNTETGETFEDVGDKRISTGGREGKAGKSAYEIAVEQGFTGSEAEWIAFVEANGTAAQDAADAAEASAVRAEAAANSVPIIDDNSASSVKTWSSEKISEEDMRTGYTARAKSGDLFQLFYDKEAPAKKIVTAIIPNQEGAGEPSISNPRNIKGISSMGMSVHEKNLISAGAVFLSATNIEAYNPRFSSAPYSNGLLLKKGFTYSMTSVGTPAPNAIYIKHMDGSNIKTSYANEIIYTPEADTLCFLSSYWEKGRPDDAAVQLEISGSPTDVKPYGGDDFYVDFGQAVYGGSYDWISGTLHVTWAGQKFDGSENWAEEQIDNKHTWYTQALAIKPLKHFADCMCNVAKKSYAYGEDNSFYMGAHDVNFIFSDKYLTRSDWNAFLSANNVTIAYEVAPFDIQFAKNDILLKRGLNILWSTEKSNTLEYFVEPSSKAMNYQKDYFVPELSENRCDPALIAEGQYVGNDGTLRPLPSGMATGFIDLSEDTTGYISAYSCVDVDGRPHQSFFRGAFYDENKNFIKWENNNPDYSDGTGLATKPIPIGAKYFRTSFIYGQTYHDFMVKFGSEITPYSKYREKPEVREIPESTANMYTHWAGKIWSSYGDSISACNNHSDGTPDMIRGWARYVNKIHGFSKFYGRSIGTQKYSWGAGGGSVCFINSKGELVDRNDSFNKDNYTGTVPAGTTACRGAFCSWDRITHMFPSNIKDTIDLIFVMGGTNDTDSSTNTDDTVSFVLNSQTDPEWAASAYYTAVGGDYNIEIMAGGIASTIMKLQAWMPNALIVIGTPMSGRGTGAENGTNLDLKEYTQLNAIKTVAEKCSIPVIDIYGTSGVNPWNRSKYMIDLIHPFKDDGIKAVGRAVASGLLNVLPKL